MRIKGWARVYEEPPMTEGGVFSFSHSIFVYPLEFLAKEKELDKASKFLGAFEVEWELEDGKLVPICSS